MSGRSKKGILHLDVTLIFTIEEMEKAIDWYESNDYAYASVEHMLLTSVKEGKSRLHIRSRGDIY